MIERILRVHARWSVALVALPCLALAGCRASSTQPLEIKHAASSKGGGIGDVLVKLEGSWVKFYEHTRDTRLLQSPDGRYIVVTDYAATKMSRISVFSVRSRKLVDITRQLHEKLGNLSAYPWFHARRFVSGSTVEFGISAYKCSAEEAPIVEALKKTRFRIDIQKLIQAVGTDDD